MSDYRLYLGDYQNFSDYMGNLERVDALITDPPYGMGNNTDSTRFTGGKRLRGQGINDWPAIAGDNVDFDPTPLLGFPAVILWGSNHYAAKLPVGTTLVWIKKNASLFGTFLSDAEIGWQKGGHGVFCHFKQFPHASRISENDGKVAHPNQKPISLMEWCVLRATNPGDTVFDPFMGSGTIGVACMRLGRNYVGCEIEPRYFEVAERRINAASLQPTLGDMAASRLSGPVQLRLE